MHNTRIILALSFLLFSAASSAELLPPLELTPASPSFSTGATANPTYPAWTYNSGEADGSDIWTIDLTAFDSNFLVSMDLTISDNFPRIPDIYRIFWDDLPSLGDTPSGGSRLFEFDTTAAIHTLRIDLLNDRPGGSFYNISIDAAAGERIPEVPVPAAFWLFGTALVGFIGISRRRKVS